MKNFFKKTWVQIIGFGILTGIALIIADNKYGLIKSGKEKTGTYKGPVTMDKKDVYVTKLNFSETEHDFGKVKEGDTLSYTFIATNTGTEPMFIYKVSGGSCDCVGSVSSSDVIAPGAVNNITVYFKTLGKKGKQVKTFVVTANTDPSESILTIKADVE